MKISSQPETIRKFVDFDRKEVLYVSTSGCFVESLDKSKNYFNCLEKQKIISDLNDLLLDDKS